MWRLFSGHVVLAVVMAMTATIDAQAVTPLARNASLSLTVTAVVDAKPDEALITFGVAAVAPTNAEARTLARPRADRLIKLLKESGVGERALMLERVDRDEIVREEWIEDDDLIEGAIVGARARISGTIILSDMALAQRIVDLLARQGIEVDFGVEYRLTAGAQETATQRARADAVRRARETALIVARQRGWRLAEMLPPRRPPMQADGKADLGGAAPEPREWGPPTYLTPGTIAVDYDLIVTFRLVR
jgi:uncharacterized protein YggE